MTATAITALAVALIARMDAEIDRRWMAGVRAEIAAMEVE